MSGPPETEIMRRAGRAAHGENWVSPFAASCGVSEGYVYRVMRGERPFSYKLRLRLTTAIDTAIADLRGRADELAGIRISLAQGGV